MRILTHSPAIDSHVLKALSPKRISVELLVKSKTDGLALKLWFYDLTFWFLQVTYLTYLL